MPAMPNSTEKSNMPIALSSLPPLHPRHGFGIGENGALQPLQRRETQIGYMHGEGSNVSYASVLLAMVTDTLNAMGFYFMHADML